MRDKGYYEDAEAGFEACDRGEPFNPDASRGWKDGWLSCEDEIAADPRSAGRFSYVIEFRHTSTPEENS